MHTISQWNLSLGVVEMDIVISALVLLCIMWCMFLFTVKALFVCSLRQNYHFSRFFLPICQSFSVESPLHALEKKRNLRRQQDAPCVN